MKTVAIIAEYNPFHKGHIYHLNKALELTNADYSIAIMGGNFLQRGQAAMWDKYTRATMCLTSSIDLVLELPFPYATGSAMDFAMGAVGILESLNSVDYLCFGAETSDIKALQYVAQIILDEPSEYKNKLKSFLSDGFSYPSAREKALLSYTNEDKYSDILSNPNNILAIEYLCALKRFGSSIEPILIQRIKANYHDTEIQSDISSATAIRQLFEANEYSHGDIPDFSYIEAGLSSQVLDIIKNTYKKVAPIHTNALTPMLQSKLISAKNIFDICDMSPEIANKLLSLNLCNSYSDTIKALKTKDVTYSRIARSLIHLLLEYNEADRTMFINDNYAYYANILGFKKESSSLIKHLHKTSLIPLITKKADFEKCVSGFHNISYEHSSRMWQLDMSATKLYNYLIYNTYNTVPKNDYNITLPII